MTTATRQRSESTEALPRYRSILIAADSSDHSNQAVVEAVGLAGLWNSNVTGTHAYAAKMHDIRFRQMEGGLPEQYRVEQELEHQRRVHDDLITRGLSVITDSYLDQVEQRCRQRDIDFRRVSLEGKNYRALVNEINCGDYDLLVLGALGVGAIEGSRVGTVCNRTLRRSGIDTLVIKQPERALSGGPLVVALDGSRKSYHALRVALVLAQEWQVDIKVIATFDPYYHYVAFNRIADVLSAEAGKVFKFKEQEKLHEDIIDSGLAKIYQGHLEVAQSIADEHGVDIETRLLDGKAYDAIQKYVTEVDASLLLIGKLGIHADPDLDIGGNAENLLQRVDCALLLCMQEHQPRIEEIAAATTSWSVEAEQRLLRVPDFVRPMARMAILRYAQDRGHTVVTESIVEAATAELMPGHARSAITEIVDAAERGELKKSVTARAMVWSEAAAAILQRIDDDSLRSNLKGRAEKKARVAKSWQVEAEHINSFVQDDDFSPKNPTELHWQAEAIARLMRAPQGFMRAAASKHIEQYARDQGISAITFEVAEKGLEISRLAMQQQVANGERPAPKAGKCPFAGKLLHNPAATASAVPWADGAKARLAHIPVGYCRNMTCRAIESIAAQSGQTSIDINYLESILAAFQQGSDRVEKSLPWQASADAGIDNAPGMVRGMLIQEIENWAKRHDLAEVTAATVARVKQQWSQRGSFHLDPADPRNID